MYAKVGRLTGAVGVNPLRSNARGELNVALGGDYKDPGLGGNLFFAYCAGQNVALFSATSAIGLQVYNPVGSGVIAVFSKYTIVVYATSASTTGFMLANAACLTAPTSTTAATATGKTFLTPPTYGPGSCFAYSIATIPVAPVVVWPLVHNTAAIASTGIDNMNGDLGGAFAAGPGTVTIIGALGAAATTATVALMWEEVPIAN